MNNIKNLIILETVEDNNKINSIYQNNHYKNHPNLIQAILILKSKTPDSLINIKIKIVNILLKTLAIKIKIL